MDNSARQLGFWVINSNNWAICFDINLPFLFQRVIPYISISPEIVRVFYKDNHYDIPEYMIRPIDPPKFMIDDQVSPVNHPELIGTIYEIIYHFNKNEAMYFIKINDKKKSKRYFEKDLVHRNMEKELLVKIKDIAEMRIEKLDSIKIELLKICREILNEYKNNGGTQQKAYNTIIKLYKLYDENKMESKYDFIGDVLDIIAGYIGNKEWLIWEEYMKTD